MTTHNLERVRRIKSRMVRLKTRGETIKEVLEKYLDDDSDMKDMNLTAKCADAPGTRGSLESTSSQNVQMHFMTRCAVAPSPARVMALCCRQYSQVPWIQ